MSERKKVFEILYASLTERLQKLPPREGFHLQHLFTKDEWLSIGDKTARQQFGLRFAADVREGRFPGVTRNELAFQPGGNEARYNYDPVA